MLDRTASSSAMYLSFDGYIVTVSMDIVNMYIVTVCMYTVSIYIVTVSLDVSATLGILKKA